MNYKDYYETLGVAKTADAKEIKRAYRKLAQKYHPDKNQGNDAAEEKFKEINEAYEVVGNAENRATYDRLGANYHRYQQAGGAPGGFDFSNYATRGQGGYQVNMDDLFGGGGAGGFSDFFTQIFGSGGGNFNRQAQPVTGRNIEHTLEIILEEAYHGAERTLVREDGERIKAKIPAGSKSGTKIRLRGKGAAGPAGNGDLMLLINVKPHSLFKRDGDNLRLDLEVDYLTAVLGGQVTVPTLAGPVTLTIPAGTQGGRTIRLKGKGMPLIRDRQSHGDLLARTRIRVPKSLSDAELTLHQQLAELQLIEDETISRQPEAGH